MAPQNTGMELFRAVHISGFARQAFDFYATPDWVTACLLRHMALRGPVWEPCCGDGAIAKILQAQQIKVQASDLEDRGYGTSGLDFFAATAFPRGCTAMITNPPYGDGGASQRASNASAGMLRFIRHALDLNAAANGQLALLVRYQWTAGKKAAALLSDGTLDKLLVLTRRIRWFDMGAQTNSGQHHHAWIIFDAARDRTKPASILFDQ